MNHRVEIQSVQIIAALLGLGQRIDLWSLLLTALALLALPGLLLFLPQIIPLWVLVGLLISLLLGVVQHLMAMRVAFDAAIFQAWADAWARDNASASPEADLAAFDTALSQRLRTIMPLSHDLPSRDLSSRLSGAQHLFKVQLIVFAVQLLALIVAMVLPYFLPSLA